MNILFIGDIVGKVGRKAISANLENVRKKYDIDFVIANGENITNGRGMNHSHYNFLIDEGVDCITLGNHFHDRDVIDDFIDNDNIVRPLNIKDYKLGSGTRVFDVDGVSIRVTNLIGPSFMNMKYEIEDPYKMVSEVIANDDSNIHIIDFHGESTGEKKANAYALKDMITAFIGTHTHVQTRDAQILDSECAYISDVGMCGSYESVLGNEINSVVERIVYHNENSHFKLLENGDSLFSAVVIKISNYNFKPTEIIPIYTITESKNEKS